MNNKDDIMQIFKAFSIGEALHHKTFKHLDVLNLSKSENEAIIEYGIQVQEEWLSVNGLMNFGDLHSLFDVISVPFLFYVDKPYTMSINLNANCFRLPAKGEKLVLKVWSRNFKESLVMVFVDVYDEHQSMIASSIHRIKTIKPGIRANEKL